VITLLRCANARLVPHHCSNRDDRIFLGSSEPVRRIHRLVCKPASLINPAEHIRGSSWDVPECCPGSRAAKLPPSRVMNSRRFIVAPNVQTGLGEQEPRVSLRSSGTNVAQLPTAPIASSSSSSPPTVRATATTWVSKRP
jgi:hypothetical protein